MLMMVNVDDTSCEAVPFIIDKLMDKGAKSVHVVSAITKKGRPEHIYFIDAPQDMLDELAGFLACELGTIGVRIIEHKHKSFSYTMVKARVFLSGKKDTAVNEIRVKSVQDTLGKVLHVKADFEDLKIALKDLEDQGEDISFKDLKSLTELAALSGKSGALGKLVVEIQGEDKK